MFSQYTHQQPVADMLKRLIEGARNSRHRRRAMNALSVFERAPWQPQAFELALSETAPGSLYFKSEHRLGYKSEDEPDAALALADVLERYLDLVLPDDWYDQEANTPKMYSSNEAAEYLGVTPDAIKHYVHRAKTLEGVMIGNSLAFSQEALDHFKAHKRPRGRPKQAPGRN